MKALFTTILIAILVATTAFAAGSPAHRIKHSKLPAISSTEGRNGNGNNLPFSLQAAVITGKPLNTQVSAWKGPACILGGAMAHLTLGTLYCWGNFMSYAPTNLRFFDGLEHPGAQPDALYVIPLTILAQAIAMPFGPSLVKAIGASRTLLLGSWISAAAVYLASYQTDLASFILYYSFMFGAGAGLAYTSPMAAGWKWMPGSKGLVSGGVLAGFGAGGFLFSLIGSQTVNPDSLNPIAGRFPASVYDNFPVMLRKLAVLYAAISFLGSWLVTEPSIPVIQQQAPCQPIPVSTNTTNAIIAAPLPPRSKFWKSTISFLY